MGRESLAFWPQLTVLVDHHRRVPVLNLQVFQHFVQSPWRLFVPQPKLRLLIALFASTPQEIEMCFFFSCPRAQATAICLSIWARVLVVVFV